DYVYVYDGSSTGSRLLGKTCNNTKNNTFYSTGYYLTVRFRSDGSVRDTGFHASYRVVWSCGGNLFGSGTFSSPNYPSYYHDNAYCMWQLRAAYDQRIFLQFTFLQLENCCSCDYIEIYDGPYVYSPFLGKVCNNSLSTFFSTSNYMTVVFRTDGSMVGRGFNAEFTSSLTPSSVDCSSDNMNIVIEKSYLNTLGYDGHSLYLNDPHCRPQISYYNVVFSFPLNTCGNTREFENGKIVYTNSLRAYNSNYGEITRQSNFKLNVNCRMEEDSVSQILYEVRELENTTITGTGRYNTSMVFYQSSSFYYQVTQFPYEITLNQNLYIEIDMRRGDSSLVLFIDTCIASPSAFDFQSRPYYLVRNGCPIDNTYYAYTTGTSPFARFTFKAFQFLRATEDVYLQCKVLICPASDYNSRCRRGCTKRVARDVGSEHESETLVVGPIHLLGKCDFVLCFEFFLLAQILLKILHKVQRVRFFLPHRKNVRVMQRSNTKKTFRHVLLTSKDEDTRGRKNNFLNCLSKRLQENNRI
uniref:CUB and zona pellucida-like domains 1, tandem duplicate 1 n=1 Tax=Pundamilia nyererei TaxID=303518 RepID=A0A3B4F5G1_9CICH